MKWIQQCIKKPHIDIIPDPDKIVKGNPLFLNYTQFYNEEWLEYRLEHNTTTNLRYKWLPRCVAEFEPDDREHDISNYFLEGMDRTAIGIKYLTPAPLGTRYREGKEYKIRWDNALSVNYNYLNDVEYTRNIGNLCDCVCLYFVGARRNSSIYLNDIDAEPLIEEMMTNIDLQYIYKITGETTELDLKATNHNNCTYYGCSNMTSSTSYDAKDNFIIGKTSNEVATLCNTQEIVVPNTNTIKWNFAKYIETSPFKFEENYNRYINIYHNYAKDTPEFS
jgi:hypothetical protein